jgi:hypothetical protein
MCAKLVVDARVLAFAEQIQVVIRDDTPEPVRILDLDRVPAGIGNA